MINKFFNPKILFLLFFVSTCTYSQYLPWPMFMHDAQRTGEFLKTQNERGTMDSAFVKWTNNLISLTSPAIGDIDNDGEVEVVTGGITGMVYALKGEDGTIKWTYSIGASISTYCSSPAIADIDGDSEIEVVIGAQNGYLYAIKGDGSGLDWSRLVRDEISSSPAIGNVDADTNTVEIVIGLRDSTKCLRGSDGTVIWSVRTGLTSGSTVYSSPAIGNVDTNDVTIEVVVATNDTSVYALNGADGSVIWKAHTEMTTNTWLPPMLLFAPAIKDIDGNGIVEVVVHHIYGIYALNGITGAQKWKNSGYGILSGDAVNEATALADIDDDGRSEVLMRCGAIRALDESDGHQLWSYVFTATSTMGSNPVVADFEGDGKLEVLDANHTGWVACVEGETGAEKWAFNVSGKDVHTTHAIGDIDGDGCFEVVGVAWDLNSGTIYALEANCPQPVEETGTKTKDNLKIITRKNKISIMLSVDKTCVPQISLVDVTGRMRETINPGTLSKGNYEININPEELENGIYFIALRIDDYRTTKKFILVK